MYPDIWHGLYSNTFEDVVLDKGLLSYANWWHGFFVSLSLSYYFFDNVYITNILSLQPISDYCSLEVIQ